MLPEARSFVSAPLIGRDEELTILQALWSRVVHETQSHLVTVLGEPGIGKSRLVAELVARLPDALVLHGRCLPYGTTLGYYALAEIVRAAATIGAADEPQVARAKLSNLVASKVHPPHGDPHQIALHMALLTGLDTDADRTTVIGDQRVLHRSVCHFFATLAQSRPLCLIFEDIHWADDALLDLIELLASRVREAPMMIVTQTRPELLDKRSRWGSGVRSSTMLSLNLLSEELERELVLALCRERGLPETVARQIGGASGGNPLFAEEMVAMAAEHGQATSIPTALKMLIAARIDALPELERDVLQLAAIFGKDFWEHGLRSLYRPGSDDLVDQLEALEQKDLLRLQARSLFPDTQQYSFKHDLIRDVAYELLPKARRQALHGQVMTWLEQHAEVRYDLLAYHAVAADKQQRAVNYLVQAAERASRASAHRQEAAILGEAAAIAERIGLEDRAVELQARRGAAFVKAGMWTSAKPDLESALLKLMPQQSELRAKASIDMADVSYWLGDMTGLRQYAQAALEQAERAGHDELIAGALAHLSQADSSDGNLARALELSEHAIARIGRIAPILGNGVGLGGLIAYWLGRIDDSIRLGQEATQAYREWNDTALFVLTYGQWALALAGSGRYAEADQRFAEAIQYARDYEIWPFVARTTALSAGFHLDLFDFEGHATIAEEARKLAQAANFSPPAASAGIDLLLNFARRQELGRAEALLPEIAAVVEKAGGFHGWLWRLRLAEARAEIALARGDWEAAVAHADSAIEQSRARQRLKYEILGLDTRAQALLKLKRAPEATIGLHEAITMARSLDDPAVFLRPAITLLRLTNDTSLASEAYATVQGMLTAMPNEDMRRRFLSAEPIQSILALMR